MNPTMEAYVEKIEAQFKLWGAQLDEMIAKSKKANAEAKKDAATAKIEGNSTVETLKAKRAEAQARLQELKAAGAEKWEMFKSGVEKAKDDLAAAFEKMKH